MLRAQSQNSLEIFVQWLVHATERHEELWSINLLHYSGHVIKSNGVVCFIIRDKLHEKGIYAHEKENPATALSGKFRWWSIPYKMRGLSMDYNPLEIMCRLRIQKSDDQNFNIQRERVETSSWTQVLLFFSHHVVQIQSYLRLNLILKVCSWFADDALSNYVSHGLIAQPLSLLIYDEYMCVPRCVQWRRLRMSRLKGWAIGPCDT